MSACSLIACVMVWAWQSPGSERRVTLTPDLEPLLMMDVRALYHARRLNVDPGIATQSANGVTPTARPRTFALAGSGLLLGEAGGNGYSHALGVTPLSFRAESTGDSERWMRRTEAVEAMLAPILPFRRPAGPFSNLVSVRADGRDATVDLRIDGGLIGSMLDLMPE